MKKSTIFAALCIATAGVVWYNNTQAQNFNTSTLDARSTQIRNLLLEEIKNNPIFNNSRDALQFALENSDGDDLLAPECPKYAGLLFNAVNQNALMTNFYNIQSNFGYSFVTIQKGKPVMTTYNFFSAYNDNGTFAGIKPSITTTSYTSEQTIQQTEANNYVINNICRPLNEFLSSQGNGASGTILNKMRSAFTK